MEHRRVWLSKEYIVINIWKIKWTCKCSYSEYFITTITCRNKSSLDQQVLQEVDDQCSITLYNFEKGPSEHPKRERVCQARKSDSKLKNCIYCNKACHKFRNCNSVTIINEGRKVLSDKKKLCFNCTKREHQATECKCENTCSTCKHKNQFSWWYQKKSLTWH